MSLIKTVTDSHKEKQVTFHQISIEEKKRKYLVSVLEDGNVHFAKCSCGSESFCEHFYLAISGKAKFINTDSIDSQLQLISSLNTTLQGKALLSQSKNLIKQSESSWLKNQIQNSKNAFLEKLIGWLASEEK